MLPPGIMAKGRTPRAGIGMLVDGSFPMPQNPVAHNSNALMKSMMQVSGVATSIGPTKTQLHGCGWEGMNGLSDTFGDLGQYAVYAVGALLVGAMLFGLGKKRGGGGSRPLRISGTATPAAAA